MENKELTPEQKKKLVKLLGKTALGSLGRGLKYGSILLIANLIVAIVNHKYVNSEGFMFMMMVINCLFVFKHMNAEIMDSQKKTSEEYKKILES